MSRKLTGLLAAGAIAAVAMAVLSGPRVDEPVPDPVPTPGGTFRAAVIGDPRETYDPVTAGEEVPEGFRQVLRRDDIDPVYDPALIPGSHVDWDPQTLIVGVALGGEAKAYPINFLNVHEMVNDWIGGTPVLVSW